MNWGVRISPALFSSHLGYPAVPFFFFALTLQYYFSAHLPCCALIFLCIYPTAPRHVPRPRLRCSLLSIRDFEVKKVNSTLASNFGGSPLLINAQPAVPRPRPATLIKACWHYFTCCNL